MSGAGRSVWVSVHELGRPVGAQDSGSAAGRKKTVALGVPVFFFLEKV